MNKLTSPDIICVFSLSAVWLYSKAPGSILSQLLTYLIRSFKHWFYEFGCHWVTRQQALTGFQTSCLPLLYVLSPPALYTELHYPGLHSQLWVLYLPLDAPSLTLVHQEISSWPRLCESFAPEVKLGVIIYRQDYTVVIDW